MTHEDAPAEEELDSQWDELSEEEQQQLLEENELTDSSWGELEYVTKLDVLGYDEAADHLREEESDEDEETDEDEFADVDIEVDDLFVDGEVELVGNADPSVTVAGIDVPGATEIGMSGEGRESQYLREVSPDGEDDQQWFDDQDAINSTGDDGGGPRMGGDPSGGEEPPLHIEITGRMGQQRAEQFVELREQDEVFSVSIGETSFEDMELHDFTRELTGDHPYDYSVRIEVVEWREVELTNLDLSEWFSGGDSSGGSSDSGGDPTADASEFESGSPDDPQQYDLEPGEQRNFRIGDDETVRNALIDTTADGAGATLYPDGEGWEVREIGWRAEDNRSGIVARGSGTIDTIFLGHGGDSGIVGELLRQVEIGNINLQDSSNGIRLTDETIENLEFSSPSSGE